MSTLPKATAIVKGLTEHGLEVGCCIWVRISFLYLGFFFKRGVWDNYGLLVIVLVLGASFGRVQ
jgi:hypothetical protein